MKINDEWYTPQNIISAVHDTLGRVDVDPASCAKANEIVRADKFYSINDSGLEHEWHGKIFLNPPFSRELISKFVAKFCAEYEAGNIEAAIVLTNATPETKWFRTLAERCEGAIFTFKKTRFMQADGTPAKDRARCGQCIFYFGQDPNKFFTAFRSVGYPVFFHPKK